MKRPKDELDWDEEALVKKLGMEYHNLPFKSPAGLTDEVLPRPGRYSRTRTSSRF